MGHSVKKSLKYLAIAASGIVVLGVAYVVSITTLSDPLSKTLRKNTENSFNGYVDLLMTKTATGSLNSVDKAIMNAGTASSIAITKFIYPEASALLHHYVYGDGSDLQLPSDYFQTSEYLNAQIDSLGNGQHGPINFKQEEDWRLSLVFNPYFLQVTPQKVKIYHPQIEFAPVKGEQEPIFVALGKMKLKIYDNLFSAMNPTPFYAYAEWEAQ